MHISKIILLYIFLISISQAKTYKVGCDRTKEVFNYSANKKNNSTNTFGTKTLEKAMNSPLDVESLFITTKDIETIKDFSIFQNLNSLSISGNKLDQKIIGLDKIESLNTFKFRVDTILISEINLNGKINELNLGIKKTNDLQIFNQIDSLKKLKIRVYKFSFSNSYKIMRTLNSLTLNSSEVKMNSDFDTDKFALKNLSLNAIDTSIYFTERLSELKHLTSFSISGKELKGIHENIKYLKNVKSLKIGAHSLYDLPEELSELNKLTSFEVSNIRFLRKLPYFLNDFTNLKSLTLENIRGGIEKSELDFTNLSNLEELSIGSIFYTDLVPKTINSLKKLRKIKFSNLLRANIALNIDSLSLLENLVLRDIPKVQLDGDVSKLTNLQNLELAGIDTTESKTILVDNPKLETMIIKRVGKWKFKFRNFSDMKYLISVNLKTHLDQTSLQELEKAPNLKQVRIKVTDVQFPKDWFNNYDLKTLNIEYHSSGKQNNTPILLPTKNIDELVLSGEFKNFSFNNKLLQNVTSLIIRDSKLESLPNDFFTNCRIKRLKLYMTKIKYLPKSFTQLKNLEELVIQDTPLDSLPYDIDNLTNLKKILLCYYDLDYYVKRKSIVYKTKMEALPERFSNLSNLTHLVLNGVNLASLPDSFGELDRLEVLHLDKCDLDNLPDNLAGLENLWYLYLYPNENISFPNSVLEISNLKRLILKNVNEISDNISDLSQLERLTLEGKIDYIPTEISNLNKLKYLSLKTLDNIEMPKEIHSMEGLSHYHDDTDFYYLNKFYGGVNYNDELFYEIGLINGVQNTSPHGMIPYLWIPQGLYPSVEFNTSKDFKMAFRLSYLLPSLYIFHLGLNTKVYTNFKNEYNWTISPDLGFSFLGIFNFGLSYNIPINRFGFEEQNEVQLFLFIPIWGY